ncbi:unnamed protein product, partial [Symbiodinium pilosum]
ASVAVMGHAMASAVDFLSKENPELLEETSSWTMCGKSAVPAGTNAAPGRDLHERHV